MFVLHNKAWTEKSFRLHNGNIYFNTSFMISVLEKISAKIFQSQL